MVILNMLSCLLPHEFINCLSHDIHFEYLDNFIFCWIDDIFNFLKDVHEFEYRLWPVFQKLQAIKFHEKKSNVKFTKANLIFFLMVFYSYPLLFVMSNVFLNSRYFIYLYKLVVAIYFLFSWSHHKRQVSFATKDLIPLN